MIKIVNILEILIIWLESALHCAVWHWDGDQHVAAIDSVKEAKEALVTLRQYDDDMSQLKSLCTDLLKAADMLGGEPHYIVQPFFGIVLKNKDIINKMELFGEDTKAPYTNWKQDEVEV